MSTAKRMAEQAAAFNRTSTDVMRHQGPLFAAVVATVVEDGLGACDVASKKGLSQTTVHVVGRDSEDVGALVVAALKVLSGPEHEFRAYVLTDEEYNPIKPTGRGRCLAAGHERYLVVSWPTGVS